MSLKQSLKKLRENYVRKQVKTAALPAFSSSAVCRYRIVFSGRVQKVGFRLETSELAKRLGLTGFCQNLENGDVLAELQGPEDRILFLISFMEHLKRIRIRRKTITRPEIRPDETDFLSL